MGSVHMRHSNSNTGYRSRSISSSGPYITCTSLYSSLQSTFTSLADEGLVASHQYRSRNNNDIIAIQSEINYIGIKAQLTLFTIEWLAHLFFIASPSSSITIISSMVYLTFDIYEKIIEILANDLKTLKCCSLVCSTFCELSRKHIFSSIDLKYFPDRRNPTHRSNHLQRLFNRNASIAKYVRTFRYITGDTVKTPRIPRDFHRVNTFVLLFQEQSMNKRNWATQISNNFKKSLKSFIRSNSIVNLTLFNIEQLPVVILLHFPCLTGLDLQHVSFCDGPLPQIFGNPTQAPKLVMFQSNDSELEPLRKILCCDKSEYGLGLDITDLENINIVVEDGFISMDLTLTLIRASQTLKSLTLTGCYPDLKLDGRLTASLSKASLQTLKRLTISPALVWVADDPYAHLLTELDQIKGKNVLESIYISVQIQTNGRCTTELSRWAPLDSIVSRRNDFPFLQEVGIAIVIYDMSDCYHGFQARLEDIGRTAFPRLKENKDLSFQFKVRVESV